MNDEWDDISNDPEDSEVEEDREIRESEGDTSFSNLADTWGSTAAYGTVSSSYDGDVIRSEEIIRVSAENDFECSRHGRVQSFRLFANGYRGDRPPREVNTCLHCFMDLLSRQCNSTDSDEDMSRENQNRRDMSMMRAMQETRVDPPVRISDEY